MTPYALPVGTGGVNLAMHGIAPTRRAHAMNRPTKRAHAMRPYAVSLQIASIEFVSNSKVTPHTVSGPKHPSQNRHHLRCHLFLPSQ